MHFGAALDFAKAGQRIARQGWNGRGMWVCYMPGMLVEADQINERTRKYFKGKGALIVGAYFVMWTADGTWQPGWLASQTDMLAEDWEVVL